MKSCSRCHPCSSRFSTFKAGWMALTSMKIDLLNINWSSGIQFSFLYIRSLLQSALTLRKMVQQVHWYWYLDGNLSVRKHLNLVSRTYRSREINVTMVTLSGFVELFYSTPEQVRLKLDADQICPNMKYLNIKESKVIRSESESILVATKLHQILFEDWQILPYIKFLSCIYNNNDNDIYLKS